MRPEWKSTLRLCIFAALFIAVCWYCIPRLQAQGDAAGDPACTAEITSIYVLQTDADVSADDVALVNDWQTDDTRWGEAVGLPEYTLYVNADASDAERQFWKVFASRRDADAVVVMRWSYERMFGHHTDSELHHHPDCTSGTVSRADVEAALAGQE